jgi:hypothetical protein
MPHFVNVNVLDEPPLYVNILNIRTIEASPGGGTIITFVGEHEYRYGTLDCDTVIKAICLLIEGKPPFTHKKVS